MNPAPRSPALFEALHETAHAHDFYATLRRIEAEHSALPRLGKAQRPRDEPVRLGQDVELDFAPAALSSMSASNGVAPRLGQRFFGLFGPMGPLPLHLTEYVRERERHHGDAAPARFADVFHHRALLLFYRAWAQSQPTTHLDRRQDDDFSRWTGSFCGLGQADFERADSIPVDAKRYRAAILARSARSAEGLTKLLHGWFAVPVRVQGHVGHWLHTRAEDRTQLVPLTSAQPRNLLGVNAVAGDRVWDRQSKFRLHLGPLTLAQYLRFLPGRPAVVELRDWVRQYVGLGLAFDVVLWLRGSEVPRLTLNGRDAQAAQLGCTTWLGQRARHPNRGDLRLGGSALSRSGIKGSTHG